MKSSTFFEELESKLMPIANKISSQRHLKAIRDSFLSMLPVTLAGGIVSVLGAAPVTETTTNSFLLAWGDFADKYNQLLTWINATTIGAMSFYLLVGITYYLSRYYKEDPFHPLLAAISGFFLLVLIPGDLGFEGNFAEITYFGGQGIVPAIIIGILTVELYVFLKRRKVGEIKMPPNVPAAISKTFGVLVPILMINFLYVLIYLVFYLNGTTLVESMYSILEPTFGASDNLLFTIIITLITNLLFFFGIHDTAVAGFVGPIREGNLAINASAKLSGEALPRIFTTPFWVYFVIIGGVGASLALGLLLLTSKSKIGKYVGRIGIIPAFFGINEPIVFGLPVVFNPIFFIPFMLAPLVNGIAAFLLMKYGFLDKTFAMLSWNMPNIFGVYLSTLDVRALIFNIVATISSMLIYYPFFKIFDNQQYELEQKELKNND